MHTARAISPPLTVGKNYAKASLKQIWAERIDPIQKDFMDTNGTAVQKQGELFK